MNETPPSQYCKYAAVSINDKINCAAFIDSGNTYRTCISADLARKLDIPLNTLKKTNLGYLGTAKKGALLRILGETPRPIHIRFGNMRTKVACRPLVVRDLSCGLNISGCLMKHYGIDQLHSENALRFQKVLVPLYAKPPRAFPTTTENVIAKAYAKQDYSVPPNGRFPLRLTVPDVEAGRFAAGDALLTGSERFMNHTDLHPLRNVMVSVLENGDIEGEVMNTTDQVIDISKGTLYGEVEKTALPEEQELYPWRTCAIPLEEETPPTEEEKSAAQVRKELNASLRTREQRLRYLQAEFRVDDSDCLKTENERARLLSLLLQNWDIISVHGEPGRTDLVEHSIPTGETPPIKCKSRPINPIIQKELKKQVDAWLTDGVIQESDSGWSFPVVAVPKKNGKTRFAVDYRRLNRATAPLAYPMPSVDEALSRLGGSAVFSCLDSSGAFNCVPVRAEDRPKTAFSTPWGLFEFKMMPFGLAYAPMTYCRLVEKALSGVAVDNLISYLDDAIVFTPDNETHFRVLQKVFDAYRKAGLRLQPRKCNLFRSATTYLGHEISKEGLRPLDSYVRIVREWPLPKTRTEVRAFLGKVLYYKRYIKNVSELTKDWHAVTGKGSTREEEEAPVEVTDKMRRDFDILKKKLTQAPVLAYPRFGDPKSPFIIDADWSATHNTIGGVLSQMQDGEEKVIAYSAKKLPPSKAKYTPYQGEMLAVIEMLKEWRHYLIPGKFKLRTDHEALKWLHKIENPNAMTLRWLATLAQYDFDIEYRPGPKHGNADALSRCSHPDPWVPDSDGVEEKMIDAPFPLAAHLFGQETGLSTLTSELAAPFSATAMAEAQKRDVDLRRIHEWVLSKHEPSNQDVRLLSEDGRLYCSLLRDLEVADDGCLYRLLPDNTDLAWTRDRVVCVPADMQDDVIRYFHTIGGHQGRDSTLDRIRSWGYFPHMKASVSHFIDACRDCQEAARKPEGQRHTHRHIQDGGRPFAHVHVDFVGPLVASKRSGAKYLFTVKDVFTRYFLAFPTQDCTAQTAADLLEREVYCKFGAVERCLADNASCFLSRIWNAMGEELGIQLVHSPAYHPQANIVERSHAQLGAILRKLCKHSPQDWEDYLPQALYAINTSKHASTGLEPFTMLFGRHASTPLHVAFGNPSPLASGPMTFQKYAKALRNRVEAAQRYAREHMRTVFERRRALYNRERHLFQPGDKCWVFNPSSSAKSGRKLARYWSGPWVVVRQINDVLYRLTPHAEMGSLLPEQNISIDRMKTYSEPHPTQPRLPAQGVDDMDAFRAGLEDDEFGEFVELPDAPPAPDLGAAPAPAPVPPAAAPVDPVEPVEPVAPAAPEAPPVAPAPQRHVQFRDEPDFRAIPHRQEDLEQPLTPDRAPPDAPPEPLRVPPRRHRPPPEPTDRQLRDRAALRPPIRYGDQAMQRPAPPPLRVLPRPLLPPPRPPPVAAPFRPRAAAPAFRVHPPPPLSNPLSDSPRSRIERALQGQPRLGSSERRASSAPRERPAPVAAGERRRRRRSRQDRPGSDSSDEEPSGWRSYLPW